jgi:hypothetical protein
MGPGFSVVPGVNASASASVIISAGNGDKAFYRYSPGTPSTPSSSTFFPVFPVVAVHFGTSLRY